MAVTKTKKSTKEIQVMDKETQWLKDKEYKRGQVDALSTKPRKRKK